MHSKMLLSLPSAVRTIRSFAATRLKAWRYVEFSPTPSGKNIREYL